MAAASDGSQAVADGGLTKGARITGDQRSSLAKVFGERYAGGESIRSIASDTGRSYGFVHGVLKESGASLRGRGGATRGPRRGAADKLADQLGASVDTDTASAVVTKAKAARDRAGDATDKSAKAKGTKDDKPKKKVEAKKSGKKGKKG